MHPVKVIFCSLRAVKDPSFGWFLIVDPHSQGDNVGKSLSFVCVAYMLITSVVSDS